MTGAALKSRREARGVTQTLLSQCASWTPSYNSRLERRSEVSLVKAQRYLLALEHAAALAVLERESEARAEAELLARFSTAPACCFGELDQNRSFTLDAEPPTTPANVAVVSEYDLAVERLRASYGEPKALGDSLLFSRSVSGTPVGGFIVTRQGWKRVDARGTTVGSGTGFEGLL